ncbi:VOC family protein [Bacillus sp. FJAT-29790]|uniref:VOC family protein n=1 Tax=Bacillus sp. FJAT-29790 TaxID=1895002 RepID=UPI001C224DAA|nr:VOC family protein [Bacillus sp. FJAT-29790]MBU8879995.1 VOC family protein [Bacillus sp. FJAT-29790]
MQKINTFLMFNGKAEEAMNFYISLFSESEIARILHHEDGTVMHATFTLKGQTFMAIDNMNKQDIPFTPAISLFVTCDTSEEIEEVFAKLSQDGQVLMPLAPSPVSEKFGWVADKYGVSWQLNLAKVQ